jgi:alkylated DNA repair dioxygenase AlkB
MVWLSLTITCPGDLRGEAKQLDRSGQFCHLISLQLLNYQCSYLKFHFGIPPSSSSPAAAAAQVVLEVKAAVEQLHPGTVFNSCLLNLYQDGNHHVSWHSDNEKL